MALVSSSAIASSPFLTRNGFLFAGLLTTEISSPSRCESSFGNRASWEHKKAPTGHHAPDRDSTRSLC